MNREPEDLVVDALALLDEALKTQKAKDGLHFSDSDLQMSLWLAAITASEAIQTLRGEDHLDLDGELAARGLVRIKSNVAQS
jgi:hypothetical protein